MSRAKLSRPRTFVFLGPSLPAAAAARLLPDATFLPPAGVGDVYRLVRRARPARIALVDGYFERMAAPWHKELLYALGRGVAVYGAASMGALRAAELADFGMIGVGAIYRDFRAGRLVADDEVAVAHLPAAQGFRPVSTALVDLRAGLAAATRAGVLDARAAGRLVAHARAAFYRDRTWELVVAAAPARRRVALAGFASAWQARGGAKAADARALLRRLARDPAHAATPPPRPAWRLAETWFFRRFAEMAAAGPLHDEGT